MPLPQYFLRTRRPNGEDERPVRLWQKEFQSKKSNQTWAVHPAHVWFIFALESALLRCVKPMIRRGAGFGMRSGRWQSAPSMQRWSGCLTCTCRMLESLPFRLSH